jgi:hypothetical protein
LGLRVEGLEMSVKDPWSLNLWFDVSGFEVESLGFGFRVQFFRF